MKVQKGEQTMRAEFEVVDDDGQRLTLRVAAIGQLLLFALAADAAILSTFAVVVEKEERPEDVLLLLLLQMDFWNSTLHKSLLIVSLKNCMTILVRESTTLALRRGWV